MKTQQPNFEKIKTALYNVAINSSEVQMAILIEQVTASTLLPPSNTRKAAFKKELNAWLDRMDIRCVGVAIDVAIKCGAKLPDWMVRKSFSIDYNSKGFLDLYKTS